MRRVAPLLAVLLAAACDGTPPSSPMEAPTTSAESPSASPSPTPEPTTPPAPIATDAATIEDRYTAALPLFDYEPTAPLEVEVNDEPVDATDWGALHEISYASPSGDRVTGILGVPNGDGPFPAVLVMHGMPGAAADFMQLVTDYPAAGVVALAIDAPFVRADRQGDPLDTTGWPDLAPQDQVELVRDLRRAVDVLQARPDVDPERIGYQGFSYGAAIGGQLAGVEPRIAAFVLAVGDGGLVEHLHDPRDYPTGLATVPLAERTAWIGAMEPIEPIYFIGRATAPILFQSAREDEFVAVDAAERYHAAAPAGADVRWYESGHFLPPDAFCEASAWLDGNLDFEGILSGCE